MCVSKICGTRPGVSAGVCGGIELGGSRDCNIKLPDDSSMRVAEKRHGILFSGLRSVGTKPPLLQRLLDDDVKPSEVHGKSRDSS
jgi:hypothetical protein